MNWLRSSIYMLLSYLIAVVAMGAYPVIEIRMPFDSDSEFSGEHYCTQEPNTTFSHKGSLGWSVDFNTNNYRDEVLIAPITGMAYTLPDRGPNSYGNHVNIDLSDGTFILIAHLKEFRITSGTLVRQGQTIGIEGDTGFAQGDHIHIARMVGDARLDGLKSHAIEELRILAKDSTTGETSFRAYALDDLTCGCCPPDEPLGDNYLSNNISGCCSEIVDLDCFHWAWDYWQTMLDGDIIEDEACAFDSSLSCVRPDAIMTRAQLCKSAMVALGIDLIPGATEPFTDIGPSHPYYAYVATLYQLGVVSGCNPPSNTLFCPDGSILRSPASKILIKTLKLRPDVDDIDPDHAVPVGTSCQYACDANSFTDNTTDQSLCVYVETSKQMGFVSGYEDSGCLFGPNAEMTRSHVAKVLHRMLGWLENRDHR